MFKTAEEKLDKKITRRNWVTRAAVMNLNKRGGYNKTYDPNQISNYVDTYKDFINREIEIINPQKIIFMCGINYSKIIIDTLNVSKYKVYYAPHPAKWGSDKNFLIEVNEY